MLGFFARLSSSFCSTFFPYRIVVVYERRQIKVVCFSSRHWKSINQLIAIALVLVIRASSKGERLAQVKVFFFF